MKLMKFGFPIFGLMLGSFAVHADAGLGKALHEKSCTKCHDSSVYTRPNKRVKTLAALQERVSGCTKPAGVKWSKQETMDVVEYLNTEFYHFK